MPAGTARTLLVTVTGRDRPGVTSALFASLGADSGARDALGQDAGALGRDTVEVLDVEQVVIRGRLVLGVLVAVPPTADTEALDELVARVRAEMARLGMDVEVAHGELADPPAGSRNGRPRDRSHVTVLGHPLRPAAVAGLAGAIAAAGANIDRIVRIARYPVTALQLDVSGAPAAVLRPALAVAAVAAQVDVAVQSAGLHRRGKRLVVMDVDSTLLQGEVIELLADRAGCGAEVARVTEQAMLGDLDFATSLRARVALLEGLEIEALEDVRRSVRLAPGTHTLVRTLKRLDHRIGIVSGGFTHITDALTRDLELDYSAANTLEVAAGRLTGRLVGPVLDRAGKAAALERFAADARVPLAQTVAIGDGANDLDMIARAGLGVAFNAKPVVRDAADTALSVPYLDAILYLLGIPREEVEAADAEDGLPVDDYLSGKDVPGR